MTFPKKGTRTITHKGDTYHWRFGRSRETRYASILVEKAAVNGQVLSLKYPTDINEYWSDFSEPQETLKDKIYRPARPEMISNFISQALDLGWKPDISLKILSLIADENDNLCADKG